MLTPAGSQSFFYFDALSKKWDHSAFAELLRPWVARRHFLSSEIPSKYPPDPALSEQVGRYIYGEMSIYFIKT